MKKIINLISIIILVILTVLLFICGVIIIDSYIHKEKVPSFFGWKPFIVLSGSMEKQIMTGDIVVVKEKNVNEIKENDIIAFKFGEVVITHRISKIENIDGETRYITKGDNNNAEDEGYVVKKDIEGLYQFRIPKLGNLAMFVQTPIGMVVCISIPLILLAFLQMKDSKAENKILKEKENKHKEMEEELAKLRKQNEELQKK